MTGRSDRRRPPTTEPDCREVVSVGYERRSAEELIALLQRNGVEVLVDVRLNPVSRKKGLSKTRLGNALEEAGIEYRHEPGLGNPRDNREAFRQGHPEARTRFERHLEHEGAAAVKSLVDLIRRSRAALFCYERDHAECHRSAILDAAQREVTHLRVVRL